MPKTPSYRRRKGYTRAIVTLTDSVTKRRDALVGGGVLALFQRKLSSVREQD